MSTCSDHPARVSRSRCKRSTRRRLTVVADCLGAGEELLDRTIDYAPGALHVRTPAHRPRTGERDARPIGCRTPRRRECNARTRGQRRSRGASQIRHGRAAQIAGQRVRRTHRRPCHAGHTRRCRLHGRGRDRTLLPGPEGLADRRGAIGGPTQLDARAHVAVTAALHEARQ